MTATTLEAPAPVSTDGDDLVAHYAAKDDIVRGHVEGAAIQAFCGIWWVPSRNPDGLPVCQQCAVVLEQIKFRDRGQRGLN